MGSHDFIKFPPDLGNLSARTWLLLGEIQATAQRVRATPILPAHAYALDLQYLAKGVHGTTAIEGNTFAEEEVAKFIGDELPAYAARIAELRQIKNMVDAFNLVARDEMYGGSPPFSLERLNRYHQLVVNGLADSNGREARGANAARARFRSRKLLPAAAGRTRAPYGAVLRLAERRRRIGNRS